MIVNKHKHRDFDGWTILLDGETVIGWSEEDVFYEFEAIALAEKYAGQRERDAILSEMADVARRIGPAAMPEWIRGELEKIVSRHRVWREIKSRRETT